MARKFLEIAVTPQKEQAVPDAIGDALREPLS